jgi:lipopolysaccharide transport system permease protein
MREMLSELWRYRHLLYSLTWRDIRVRYAQSILGVAWAMFIPLAMMAVFTFIFTYFMPIHTAKTGGLPYAIFAYSGLLPWSLFSSSTKVAANSLVANRNLVTKIYFPREVFPLSSVLAALVDFAIGAAVLAGLLVIFGTRVQATALLLPFILVVQVLFCAGVGFFLAMGNLFYRDVRMLYEVVVMLWMFGTNVIYPLETANPTVQTLMTLNPMTPIISAYRWALFGVTPAGFGPAAFGYAAAVSIVVFAAGWAVFHRSEFVFAERI